MDEVRPNTLGRAIRARRRELGLTQEELAERISDGMVQGDISALERGRVALSRRPRLERIAAALRLSLGELLARSGWADADEYFRAAAVPPPDDPRSLIVAALPELGDEQAVVLLEVVRSLIRQERARRRQRQGQVGEGGEGRPLLRGEAAVAAQGWRGADGEVATAEGAE